MEITKSRDVTIFGPFAPILDVTGASAAADLNDQPASTAVACEAARWLVLRAFLNTSGVNAQIDVAGYYGGPDGMRGALLSRMTVTSGASSTTRHPFKATTEAAALFETHLVDYLTGIVRPIVRRFADGQCLIFVPLPAGVHRCDVRVTSLGTATRVVVGGKPDNEGPPPSEVGQSLTKTATAVWNAQNLSAAGGPTNSAAVDLRDAYEATANLKLANGVTAPTVVASVQLQVSEDNVEWYNFGAPLVGSATNGATVSWGGIELPAATQYFRAIATHGSDQAVTADLDVSKVTVV